MPANSRWDLIRGLKGYEADSECLQEEKFYVHVAIRLGNGSFLRVE